MNVLISAARLYLRFNLSLLSKYFLPLLTIQKNWKSIGLQIRSIVLPECFRTPKISLTVGIAQIMAAEIDTLKKSRA